MIYTPLIRNAINFSIKVHEIHQKQKRKGKDIPYLTHTFTVGLILARAGLPEEVIAAGILHDTIEDSHPEKKVSKGMLADRFGVRVADIVSSVTEQQKNITWEDAKAKAREHISEFSHDSLLVKSADILSNTSEILDDYRWDGEKVFDRFKAPKERVLWNYIETIRIIVKKWPTNPLADDLKKVGKKLAVIGEMEMEKPEGQQVKSRKS